MRLTLRSFLTRSPTLLRISEFATTRQSQAKVYQLTMAAETTSTCLLIEMKTPQARFDLVTQLLDYLRGIAADLPVITNLTTIRLSDGNGNGFHVS